MDPIYAVLVVILIGFLCYLAITFIPMADPFPRIVIGVAVVITVLWLLAAFGIFNIRSHTGP